MILRLFFFILIKLFLSIACFSQFNTRIENEIKLADDSAKKANTNFLYFDRIHYGLLLGYHQGLKPELEIGLHKLFTDADVMSSRGISCSYIRNIKDTINSFCFSGWFGLLGLLGRTNTKDFKSFSYSIQPIVGIEYRFLHLFYGYNINIDSYKTQKLNTHTITLRCYLWFITKRGKAIANAIAP